MEVDRDGNTARQKNTQVYNKLHSRGRKAWKKYLWVKLDRDGGDTACNL